MHRKINSTVLLYAIVATGIAIRLNQYFQRPALWLDEAMLALSIVNRPWYGLVITPLYMRQTSSPLYLQLAHASSVVFGRNELALRLPSVALSIASLILFAMLARRIFRSSTAVAATFFFALSPMLVRYAAEVKQYAADVLVSVLLILVMLRMRDARFEKRWVIGCAAAIGVAVFLSDIGVLVTGGICTALACLAWRERDDAAWRAAGILAPFSMIVTIAAAAGMYLRVAGMTKDNFDGYWDRGYWPLLPPHSLSDVVWPIGQLSRMFPLLGGTRSPGGLALLIAALGCVALWRKGKEEIVAAICGILVVSLVASIARLYPLNAARVSLYLLPPLIIAFAAGLEAIARRARRFHAGLLALLCAALIAPASVSGALSTPAELNEDIPGVLAYLRAHRQDGDKLYAYWAAAPATFFYGPEYGIDPKDVIGGKYHRQDTPPYSEELGALRGNSRVWVIFSHDAHKRERNTILFTMDSLGRRLDVYPPQTVRTDAAVYLYDLAVPLPPVNSR